MNRHPTLKSQLFAIPIILGLTISLTGIFTTHNTILASGSLPISTTQGVGSGIDYNATLNHYIRAVAVAEDDGTIYIGGSFRQAVLGPNVGGGAAFDSVTAVPDTTVMARVDGSIYVSISDGAGGWYIGGAFKTVRGVAREKLAHITSDGELDTDWDPSVGSNGFHAVHDMVLNGSTLYVAGSFDQVNTSSTPVARSNMAAFNLTDGTATSWDPSTSSSVNSLALDTVNEVMYAGGNFNDVGSVNTSTTPLARDYFAGFNLTDGTATSFDTSPTSFTSNNVLEIRGGFLYVGGTFATIDGASRGGLAKFDLSTGLITAWNPGISLTDPVLQAFVGTPSVTTMAATDTAIYVGGAFDTVNGVTTRHSGAAFDLTTGIATAWDPDFSLYILIDGIPTFESDFFATPQDFEILDSTLYATGSFENVNFGAGPVERDAIAAFNLTDGTVTAWDPEIRIDASAISGVIDDIGIDSTNDQVYVGGSHAYIGDRTSRNRLAALDADTGEITAWDPDVNGTIYAIVVTDDTVYVGGDFTQVNQSTTPLARNNLAAFNRTDGTATSWNPNVNSTVEALVASDTAIYAGGGFTTVNGGTSQRRIASFNLTDGTMNAWNPHITNYNVYGLALGDDEIYVGGDFDNVNTATTNTPRENLAAFNLSDAVVTAWDPSVDNEDLSIVVTDDAIYVAGDFTGVNNSTVYAERDYIAAFNTTTGEVLPWNPNLDNQVRSIVLHGDAIYAGGDFSLVNQSGTPLTRNHLAAFNISDGVATDWDPNVQSIGKFNAGGDFTDYDTTVRSLAVYDNQLFTGGLFDSINDPVYLNSVAIFPLSAVVVDYTLTITPSGTGTGTITSAPAGINCGVDCTEDFSDGTVVTLTATPSVGSTFTGWSGGGGCTGTGACVLTMDAAKGATTTFDLEADDEDSGGGSSGSKKTPPPSNEPPTTPPDVPPTDATTPPIVSPPTPPTTPPTSGGGNTVPPGTILPPTTSSNTPPTNPPITPTTTPPVSPLTTGKIKGFINEPVVQTFGNFAIAIPLIISAVLLAQTVALGASFFNVLSYFFLFIPQLLRFKRTPRPWGSVYDSVTKRPLPFTRVVILNNELRALESTITDLDGRYGFLASSKFQSQKGGAKIVLTAEQNNYTFPSKKEPTSTEKILYPNTYLGGLIDTNQNTTNADLPMDPTSEVPRNRIPYMGVVSIKLNNIWTNFADILFVIGIIFAVIGFALEPSFTNFIPIGLILLTFVLRISGLKLKSFGLTKDSVSKKPLPFGFIALHDLTGARVKFTTSDEQGRYFLLAPGGDYTLRAYTPAHINPMRQVDMGISARRGWVSEEITL